MNRPMSLQFKPRCFLKLNAIGPLQHIVTSCFVVEVKGVGNLGNARDLSGKIHQNIWRAQFRSEVIMARHALSPLHLAIVCAFLVVGVHSGRQVVELNEDNWRLILKNEWMVEFYAPWCPACKALEPIWRDFATWSDDIGITVARVDVTTSPGLGGRFMVSALPTIFHALDGEFRQYKGSRDKDAFISFVEEKKWKNVEPISRWQSPNSLQMTILANFFKWSQFLRQVHNTLLEEYGLPSWASYLFFALCTIIGGVIGGIFLVCVIDLICPRSQTKAGAGPPRAHDKKEKDSDDELADDDIKDDLLDDASQSEEVEEDEAGDSAGGRGDEEPSAAQSEGSPRNSPGVKKRKSRKE